MGKIRESISAEQYQKILNQKPEERVSDCGRPLDNKIRGILLAFAKKYDMRDGWLDIITAEDAEKEIRNLINEITQENKL